LLLVAIVGLSVALGNPNLRKGVPYAALYVANFVPTTWLGVLNHTWSLAVEEHFYLLWPIFFATVLRWVPSSRQLMVVLAAALLSAGWRFWLGASGADYERLHRLTDCRVESLLAGCAAAIWLHRGQPLPRGRVLKALVFALLLGMALLDPSRHQFVGTVGISVVAWGTAFLILLEFVTSSRLLSASPVVWLGKISYGVYLWHFPSLRLLRGVLPTGLGIVAAAVVTLAVAQLSWQFVERRILRR
jgi:peptidoglycan/LPS O-acetylase OafA/YrhL